MDYYLPIISDKCLRDSFTYTACRPSNKCSWHEVILLTNSGSVDRPTYWLHTRGMGLPPAIEKEADNKRRDSRFTKRAKEFLFGRPVEPVNPADIHIAQVADEVYNSGATIASANCGPASVIMAIRLVRKKVPGEELGLNAEDLILHVRKIATGEIDRWSGTHNLHLQRVLELAGCRWRILRDVKDMLAAVKERNEPVIMAGNPAIYGGYTQRYSYYDIRRSDNGHWIVVSRYIPSRDTYIINDPQSTVGPVEVTKEELFAFNSKDGDFGIAVSA